MLIEFKVKNFRSFKDEQSISMIANASKHLRTTNTFRYEPDDLDLVRSAVIYGPNASGKSNLVRAMKFVADFVSKSAVGRGPDDLIDFQPFRLEAESRESPSEFEVVLVANGVRYQYGFVVNRQEVLEEWLHAFPEGRSQVWFHREKGQDPYYGPNFKGPKKVVQDSNRPNALFLSTGAQLNHQALTPVWNWFNYNLRPIPDNHSRMNEDFTTELCKESVSKEEVLRFLKLADLGIDDVITQSKEISDKDFPDELPAELRKHLLERILEDSPFEPIFLHKISGSDSYARFSFDDESKGTQNVFAWAGPFLDVLNRGLTLVIDELDSSLHPLLAIHLAKLFHNPELNKHGAQLIFTAHSVAMLDQKELMRRDQIWFAIKDRRTRSSKLRPFTYFSAREGENWARSYLRGRYGAIPDLQQISSEK